MEKLFPPQEITIDARELNQIKDEVIQLQEEIEHLINLLDLLREGFNRTTCLERTSEVSSLHILQTYLTTLNQTNLSELLDKLDGLTKKNNLKT